MNITDFLLARITEDKEVAREAEWRARRRGVQNFGGSEAWLPDDVDGVALAIPRALAECQAKRAIIDEWTALDVNDEDMRSLAHSHEYRAGAITALLGTLGALASVYSDHPDYNPEWSP